MLDKALKLNNSKSSTLRELMGEKGMILFFYPKAMTDGCSLEVQEFEKQKDLIKELGYSVVGASADLMKDQDRFATKYCLTFPLISDDDEEVCNFFQVIKEKNVAGKKTIGIVRSTFILNPDLSIVKEFRNVSPVDHIQHVIDTVR